MQQVLADLLQSQPVWGLIKVLSKALDDATRRG